MIQITEVRLRARKEQDRNKALQYYVQILINESVVVRDIKIIKVDDRLIVAMPSRERKKLCTTCNDTNGYRNRFCRNCGTRFKPPEEIETLYYDVFYPVNKETRKIIEDAVLAEYHRQESSESLPDNQRRSKKSLSHSTAR